MLLSVMIIERSMLFFFPPNPAHHKGTVGGGNMSRNRPEQYRSLPTRTEPTRRWKRGIVPWAFPLTEDL